VFCGRLRFSVSLLILSHLDAVDLSRGQTKNDLPRAQAPLLSMAPSGDFAGPKVGGREGGKQRTLLPSPFVVLWPKGCGPANAQGVQSYSAIKKPPH